MTAYPEELLIRRYAIQAGLWALRQEIGALERESQPITSRLARTTSNSNGHRQSLFIQLQPFKARIEELRALELKKRDELAGVEGKLREAFRSVGRSLAESEEKLHREPPKAAQPDDSGVYPYDLFISHAREDKDEIIRPLVTSLKDLGISVWYDELSLSVGDSLRREIDRGLLKSRYAVVLISPPFLEKSWTNYELDSLVAKEIEMGTVILPIWHKITKDQVLRFSPKLADKVALNTATASVTDIALELAIRVHNHA